MPEVLTKVTLWLTMISVLKDSQRKMYPFGFSIATYVLPVSSVISLVHRRATMTLFFCTRIWETPIFPDSFGLTPGQVRRQSQVCVSGPRSWPLPCLGALRRSRHYQCFQSLYIFHLLEDCINCVVKKGLPPRRGGLLWAVWCQLEDPWSVTRHVSRVTPLM